MLAQAEDKYTFVIVYEQELSLYGFHQNTMINDQWYEQFNIKADVGTSIGVTRQHSVLLEWTAQSTHIISYQDITNDQKIEIQTYAEERYLTYSFLKHSAKTSEKLSTNLCDDYTTGENKHTMSRQATLHCLEKHSKSVVHAPIAQEGSSFAQREGNSNLDTFDKSIGNTRSATSLGIKYTLHQQHQLRKLGIIMFAN